MIQAGLTARATCWPASCTVSPSAAPTPTPSSPGGHLTIVLFSDWSLATQYSSLIGHLMTSTSVIFSDWSLATQYLSLIGHLITSVPVLFSDSSFDYLSTKYSSLIGQYSSLIGPQLRGSGGSQQPDPGTQRGHGAAREGEEERWRVFLDHVIM